MRSLAACVALVLALLAPATSATMLPRDWSATGEALWGEACLGELSAVAIGPFLLGEHAGDWWFQVEVDARDAACSSVTREGWIDGPYAHGAQVLRSDATGGALVVFEKGAEGERVFRLHEWATTPEGDVTTLELQSALRESSRL